MFSLNWWEKSHASPQSRGKNTWWSGRNLIRMTTKILRKPSCAFPLSRIGQLFYSGTIICKRLTMPGLMGSHELCFGEISLVVQTTEQKVMVDQYVCHLSSHLGQRCYRGGHVWISASPIVSTLFFLSFVILTERPLFHLRHWQFWAFLGNQAISQPFTR